MYRIRLNKVEELMSGRKTVYLAKLIGYSRQYMSEVFTGNRNLNKEKTEKAIKAICNDSVKQKEKLEKYGIEKMIEYFFEKV